MPGLAWSVFNTASAKDISGIFCKAGWGTAALPVFGLPVADAGSWAKLAVAHVKNKKLKARKKERTNFVNTLLPIINRLFSLSQGKQIICFRYAQV